MCIEPLKARKTDDGIGDALQAVTGKFLYRHLPHKLIDSEAAVYPGVAIGRQYVIRTTAVVPDSLRRPLANEDRARVTYSGQGSTWILYLQYQVFRGVSVADRYRRCYVINNDRPGIFQCADRD
jgi:hypothetical protein